MNPLSPLKGWHQNTLPTLERNSFEVPSDVVEAIDNAQKIKAEARRLAVNGRQRADLVDLIVSGKEPTKSQWADYAAADKRRAVYEEAAVLADDQASRAILAMRDQVHHHMRARFTEAVDHLTAVATTLDPDADSEQLLRAGRVEEARARAACAEHVAVIADAIRLRNRFDRRFTTGRQLALYFWLDEGDDLDTRPKAPGVTELLHGLNAGWKPWYPTHEEAHSEVEQRRERDARTKAHRPTRDRMVFAPIRG